MIPNIAVDNVVEKHIQALILSGDQDWVPGGLKAEEWHKRKQSVSFLDQAGILLIMDLKEHGETVRGNEKNHLLLLRHIELELEHLPLQLSTLLQFMPTTNSQIGL